MAKKPTKKGLPKKKAKAPARRIPESLPAGYGALLDDLERRIQAAQVKAALAVNSELIRLYWQIGQAIVERQRDEGWGKSVIERLAHDLQVAFPGVGGFSRQNLWYMRSFFLAWTEEVTKLQQPVGELDGSNLPPPMAAIPWGHNLQLLSKLSDPATRLWYAQKTIEQGWSRNVLVLQIESELHIRQGKAITNFAVALPSPQSDLAHELLKNPYNFDFLMLEKDAQEKHLQAGLLEHLREFLIELGVGFAFVGSRYPLEVGGQDYFLDLLFYTSRGQE